MAGTSNIGIATYNLHGLNNGRSGLIELCDNTQIHIIAVQEHWLSNNDLHLFNNIHHDFVGFGLSSMSEKLSTGIFRGRPYGGVAFLWRKNLSSKISIRSKSDSGRCLSVTLSLDSGIKINIVNVYYPCFKSCARYGVELSECLSFVEEVLVDSQPAVILGDMNFPCSMRNDGYKQAYDMLSKYDIFHCDEFIAGDACVTYCNTSLNQSSFVDHVFVSNCIRNDIIAAEVLDSGINLSDHIPVYYKFKWSVSCMPESLKANAPDIIKRYTWRWDKSDLQHYYALTDSVLRTIDVPLTNDCIIGCYNASHKDVINAYYERIVAALHYSMCTTIKRIPCHALKPYWNEELDMLKHDSIFWHNLWTDAGRPSAGALQRIRLSCKAKYKLALRNAYVLFEDKLTDELYGHFVNKNVQDFWKTWNAKFRKNISKQVIINGHVNDTDIANDFAEHFKNVHYDSYTDGKTYREYLDVRDGCMKNGLESSYLCLDLITVEVIEKCMHKLHSGKACGPDELSAESLLFAHPALLMHLKQLFKLIIIHGVVPDSFGIGIAVPLIKDKAGNMNNVDNYRAITLSPVIAKLFETVLLFICEDSLVSDSLQFGFKKGISCSDAIFTLKSSIEYFVDRGSSVFIASLDISKAFDRVNHYKLYKSLLSAGVPLIIVDILSNWYSKTLCAVRWNNCLSALFPVCSGVRQGSCLSPAIFNVFMNLFIVHLRQLNVGCQVCSIYLGCLLYADDLILISPSVTGLQSMLDTCWDTAANLRLEFNVGKCHCIVIGKFCNALITPMMLGGNEIDWCNSIKYLGVYLLNSRSIKFDINPTKRLFYAACNSIFAHGSGIDEIALLTLQETYSLSVLMYAIPAMTLSVGQVEELNVCWNSVIRKIFGYNRWESVKAVLLGLGRLNVKHLIMLRKSRFYRHWYYGLRHDLILHDFFCSIMLHRCNNDAIVRTVFCISSNTTQHIWSSFRNYVNL